MSSGLSPSITSDSYRIFRADPSRWRAAIVAVAARHGLASGAVRALGGSNLVASIEGAHIVKIFPPLMRFQWESERIALRALAGRLPVVIPELLHEGELDGWPYLILGEVEGALLETCWPELTDDERRSVMQQLGELIARVQRLPAGPVADLAPSWGPFLDAQVAGCVARHQRLGLPPALAEIPGYLHRSAPALPRPAHAVILTGEYTPANVLVATRDGRVRIVGLIDFGDAMAGAGEYDLLGPATFLAAGDRARLAMLLSGYGYEEPDRSPALRDRLMTLLLLHRYSDLDIQVRIEGWRERATSLDQVAELVFPIG